MFTNGPRHAFLFFSVAAVWGSVEYFRFINSVLLFCGPDFRVLISWNKSCFSGLKPLPDVVPKWQIFCWVLTISTSSVFWRFLYVVILWPTVTIPQLKILRNNLKQTISGYFFFSMTDYDTAECYVIDRCRSINGKGKKISEQFKFSLISCSDSCISLILELFKFDQC